MQIIKRREAIKLGLKHYFTGKVCKRGHIDKRLTSNRRCFSCSSDIALSYRVKYPEKFNKWNKKQKENGNHKKSYMKIKYGLTPEEYKNMFIERNFSCDICGIHQSELKQILSVDHSHQTGKVTGLLCFNCNSAIGKLGDTLDAVKKAVMYLERNDR